MSVRLLAVLMVLEVPVLCIGAYVWGYVEGRREIKKRRTARSVDWESNGVGGWVRTEATTTTRSRRR